jgi:hypothetical protein
MQVLIVGGEHAFVHGTLASKLEGVGVSIGSHWDWTMRRPPQVVPKGCKGVVVLHDMVGHHLSGAAKDAASVAGVPYVLVPRKFSAALPILQRAGIVSKTVPVPDVDDVSEESATDSELKTWASFVLESSFASTDRELAERLADVSPGGADGIIGTIALVRAEMRASWASARRTADAERSFNAAVTAWAATEKVDPDDPASLARIRSQGRIVFGVVLPDAVLAGFGFQPWEIRGAFTRERIRIGVEQGDKMFVDLSADDRLEIGRWLCQNVTYRKMAMIGQKLRGKPVEALAIMMRIVPDLSAGATSKAYMNLTGANIGPYYHEAVKWMIGRTPAPTLPPVLIDTSDVEVEVEVAPVVEVAKVVEVAPENDRERSILAAFDAAVESVANGGTADELIRMVNAAAAEQVEKRELEAVDAEVRAAEELLKAAQEKARSTRERVARMRGQ